MANLSNHFKSSGYAIHRSMIRKARLPQCCREHLCTINLGISYLDSNGAEIVLKVEECSECGRRFAVSNGKYMAVDNALKFDIVNLE